MGTKHQFLELSINELYTKKQRRSIAEDFINYIIRRTQEGKGPGQKAWSGKAGEYSKAYKNSWQFRAARRAAGKSGKVNLTLSGNMLESIELLEEEPGKLIIGFKEGSEENAKADGNIRGTYGKSRPNKSKARPFLGLTETEKKRILKEHPISMTAKYRKAEELRELAETYSKKYSQGIRKAEAFEEGELSEDKV